ncbi:uncharacterized protein LOC123895815 [Trifolium pratense]|uniref:uncharacterized protein LOC123895815 n=1 Tax=Trifolium pratense TaxID=57577 RepID=UPI001E695B05|nr:uncharacterized protein LOC123895815 [Trifolium pratense]
MSAATMLVINRSPSNFNLVAVGWQVYPKMYDDDKTHLFIAWGDPTTKDWHISINGKEIGYYPASLFSNMTYVDQVMWGGKTINPRNTPSPPMGYGILPDGVLGHACYFKNLAFVNEFQKSQALTKDMGATVSTNRECYGASYHNGEIGLTLQFGGPGGGNCIA